MKKSKYLLIPFLLCYILSHASDVQASKQVGDNNCAAQLMLANNWLQDTTIAAIKISSTDTISNGLMVNYKAENSITLLVGFQAYNGADFSAKILPCSSDSTSICNNCTEDQIKSCKGPRYETDCLNINDNIQYDPNQVINVKDVGAAGDGMTDDTQSIRAAAMQDKILYFPSGEYLISGTINISKGIYGEGKIMASNITAFLATSNHVFFRDVTIESTLRTGDTAPYSIYIENQDHIEITGTKLINNRIGHINSDNSYHKKLKINCNIIQADFAPFPVDTIQNDVIIIRGIDSVEVRRNDVCFNNPNRVFKIADNTGNFTPTTGLGAKVSQFNSKNIIITDNKIVGNTSSSKQLADLFHGTENIRFQYNYIESRGFTRIIENKTGIETYFAQNTSINNNIIKSDHAIFLFQGSWGAQTLNHESGIQNVWIKNNDLIGLDTFQDDRGLIRIRFFHQVDIVNNDMTFEVEMPRRAVSFYSNKNLNFSENIVHSGSLYYSFAVSNQSAEPFDSEIECIVIQRNDFKNGFVHADLGIITIDQIATNQAILLIAHNEFNQNTTTTIPAIKLKKTKFKRVDISNNTLISSSYLSGVDRTSPDTIITYNEVYNSWQ